MDDRAGVLVRSLLSIALLLATSYHADAQMSSEQLAQELIAIGASTAPIEEATSLRPSVREAIPWGINCTVTTWWVQYL
jgi:hypothetical protein